MADDQGLGKTVSTIALMVSSLTCRTARSLPTQSGRTASRALAQPAASSAAPPTMDGSAPAANDLNPALSGAIVEVTCTQPSLAVPQAEEIIHGGTLVVCPIAVLHQWSRELADKVSPVAGAATPIPAPVGPLPGQASHLQR